MMVLNGSDFRLQISWLNANGLVGGEGSPDQGAGNHRAHALD